MKWTEIYSYITEILILIQACVTVDRLRSKQNENIELPFFWYILQILEPW